MALRRLLPCVVVVISSRSKAEARYAQLINRTTDGVFDVDVDRINDGPGVFIAAFVLQFAAECYAGTIKTTQLFDFIGRGLSKQSAVFTGIFAGATL